MDLHPAADIYAFGVCAMEIAMVGGPWSVEKPEGPINADYLISQIPFVDEPDQRVRFLVCLKNAQKILDDHQALPGEGPGEKTHSQATPLSSDSLRCAHPETLGGTHDRRHEAV